MNESQQKAYDQAHVMIAYANGSKIQGKYREGGGWCDITDVPEWGWRTTDYRIAPKPLECWLMVQDDGIGYKSKAECERAAGYFGGRAVLMREVL